MKSLYPLPDKYKYFTIFASELKPLSKEKKDKYIALASQTSPSIDNLKKLLPNIDLDRNIDLLPFSAEAFVVNKINENGDGVRNREGILLANSLKLKYCDVEHNKSHLIGVILDTSFARFGSDEPLSEEQAETLDEPFPVIVSGIIWKLVNENVADLIEASSNQESDNYGKIRLSWEAAFESYNLILMDKNDKNIKGGKIITDAKKISELEQNLKSMGGNGKTKDGQSIGRVITGEPLGIGVGFTENWAADVGPIVTSENVMNIKLKNDSNSSKAYEGLSKQELFLTSWIQKYGTKKNKELTTADLKKQVEDVLQASKGLLNQEDNLKKENLNLNAPYVSSEASHSEHYENKCSCGNTISSCGCEASDKKVTTVQNGCNNCVASLKNSTDTGFPVNKPAETYNILPPAMASIENNQKSENNSLNDEKICVTTNNENKIHMKFTKITDLNDENVKQSTASEITSLLDVETRRISDEWSAKLKDSDNLKKDAETTLANTKKTLEELQSKFNQLAEAQASKEREEKFSARMGSWEGDYNLDTDDKEIIASEIKDLDDAKYETWAGKMKKLMKNKKKTAPKNDPDNDGDNDMSKSGDKDKDYAGKQSNASIVPDKTINDVIDNGKKDTQIPNTVTPELTILEKAKASFAPSEWAVDSRRLKRAK